MEKIFDDKKLMMLKNEKRINSLRVDETLDLMRVDGNIKVLDVGAGIGVFTFPIAERITGEVIALDLSDKMTSYLKQVIKNEGYNNITTILGTVDDIEKRHFDRIFLVHILHEVSDPDKFAQQLSKLLSANGLIAVLEWKKIQQHKGPKYETRISEEEVHSVFSKYFEEVIRIDWGESFYLSIYEARRYLED